MNYSSGLSSSSLGMLSRISESENENYGVGTGADDEENLGNGNGDNDQFYSSSYPFGAWNDSLNFEENLTGIIKREVDDGVKSFGDLQTTEVINRPPMLSHHLSLPKTSSEMAAVEKVLQFQDTIPCKIRAKRGCATHPRSIAERVRRTKISERMRKLQDLVPNMDKQTNTADMLDLAVEYIKDLQQQHKNLADARSNCTCTTLEKQV
ncbi:basic helix-loop-helix transcription factor [Lithospermum erythrorhizon]|uniref:Basic helix-loop-helix transcription factor n=1 Tax=Lithospermum erythrorhizon TaxID=34254 RepID=A0AAV3RQT6_LITER